MRTWKLITLSVCVVFTTLPFAKAEPLPDLTITDSTAEDGLLILAKAYNANVYIDSSRISATDKLTRTFVDNDPRVKLPERQRFVIWMMDHKLTMLQRDKDYLFWAEPEIEDVWQSLNRDVFGIQQKLPTEAQSARWIRDYLKKNPQEAQKLSQPFSLAEAPESLKEWLAAVTISTMGKPTNRYISHIFTDSFWDNARLTRRLPPANQNRPPDAEVEKAPVWPFDLQTLLNEEYPPVLLHYSPVWGLLNSQPLVSHRISGSAPKTAEGIARTETFETHIKVEGSRDLRVRETTPPKATTPQRFIESRPSLANEETPWQKIEDEAEIQKALIQMGEISTLPEASRQALQLFNEIQTTGASITLPEDKALEKAVSLEMKRQPLPFLLEELSKQSGIKLSLKAAIARDVDASLITLRVQNRPVLEVLDRLSRLYALEWTKHEEGRYEALLLDRANWRVQLTQMGNTRYYRHRDWWNGVNQQREDKLLGLANRVWEKFGEEALTEPNSVKFADLPVDLQKAIRRESDERLKFIAVRDQLSVFGVWRLETRYQLFTQPRRLLILRKNYSPHSVLLNLPGDSFAQRRRATSPSKTLLVK